MAEHGADDFYVNYFPVPRRLRSFVIIAAPLAVAIVTGVAVTRALMQADPGAAIWDDGTPKTFVGTIHARPYPMIVVDSLNATGEDSNSHLLVELGKRGAERAAAFDGQRVTLSGWTLERDGRRIIELEPGDVIVPTEGNAGAASTGVIAASITLRGEILDSKCYLGAMKPGEGKTHKACATLCIQGGIPPMLVVRQSPRPRYVLLTNATGDPIDESDLRFVADPVEITGELLLQNGLEVLRIAPGGIQRI